MICLGKTPAFPDFGRAPCCRLHLRRAAKDRSDGFNWFAEHAGLALYTIAMQQAPVMARSSNFGVLPDPCYTFVIHS